MNSRDNPLVYSTVYSTATGRINTPEVKTRRPPGDGIVRIQRQVSGRRGKGVCLISGID